jgi:glucose/arabinose dehydrogenase
MSAQAPAAANADWPDSGRVVNISRSERVRLVPVAKGLVHPWSLALLPGGDILVTERAGRLRIIRNGALDPEPISGVPKAFVDGLGGLLGIALHPDFAQNGLVYLSYSSAELRNGQSTLAVTRAHLKGRQLVEASEILVTDAHSPGGAFAGRMLFGRDGTFFLSVGHHDPFSSSGDTTYRMKAQDLNSHAGKTLRLTDDGKAPKDNPFVGKPNVKPEIFTYGHRNGYGLAIHPVTGELWQAEIGPAGGDELNVLLPGRNYGWPLVSLGRNYNGTLVSDQPWARPGMENPRLFWVPSVSPAAIAFYTGDKFPNWKGSILVGTLTSRELLRVIPGEPGQGERRISMLRELGLRVRDVQQGPDGLVYIATEMTVSGTTPDGMVLRIEPAP